MLCSGVEGGKTPWPFCVRCGVEKGISPRHDGTLYSQAVKARWHQERNIARRSYASQRVDGTDRILEHKLGRWRLDRPLNMSEYKDEDPGRYPTSNAPSRPRASQLNLSKSTQTQLTLILTCHLLGSLSPFCFLDLFSIGIRKPQDSWATVRNAQFFAFFDIAERGIYQTLVTEDSFPANVLMQRRVIEQRAKAERYGLGRGRSRFGRWPGTVMHGELLWELTEATLSLASPHYV